MKKIFLLFIVAGAVAGISSCSKSSSPSTPQAQVLYMNAWLNAENLSVTANSTAVPNGTNLAFLANTGYQGTTAATARNINFVIPSNQNTVADSSYTFTANTHYSVYVVGLLTGSYIPTQVMTTDDLTAPPSGSAKVRFINLGPDTASYTVNVGAGNAPVNIGTNIAYKQCTPFVNVTAISNTGVLAQDTKTPTQLVQLSGKSFSAGKIYTIVFTGTSTGTGTSALTLTIVNNN